MWLGRHRGASPSEHLGCLKDVGFYIRVVEIHRRTVSRRWGGRDGSHQTDILKDERFWLPVQCGMEGKCWHPSTRTSNLGGMGMTEARADGDLTLVVAVGTDKNKDLCSRKSYNPHASLWCCHNY